MKKIITIILFVPFFCFSQKNESAVKIADAVKSEDICNYVHTLASEEFGGRETGNESLIVAAKYIAEKFKEFGVAPGNNDSYFQNYPLRVLSTKSFSLSINGVEEEFLKNYFVYPDEYPPAIEKSNIVFTGYGIKDEKWDDYKSVNYIDEIVMVLGGEPKDASGNSRITGNKSNSPWSRSRKKIGLLNDLKPAAIIYVTQDFKKIKKQSASFVISERIVNAEEVDVKIPVIYVSVALADKLLSRSGNTVKSLEQEMLQTGSSVNKYISDTKVDILSTSENKQIEVPNVAGYIKGTDLKDELIVISAHFDHLGIRKNKTYNGADDNGSGTSALLSIAKAYGAAYKEGVKPRRSVLFIAVSGEEKGLLGSNYYVNNPIYPLEKTVSNLNIDMIGRWDKAHKGNENYVYLIGSDRLSSDLHNISEEANKTYTGLELDYKFNAKNDPNMFYYRSDHYNFAKKGIPVIFYFSGVHKDYHKPTDTAKKIICPKVEKIAKLVFHTSWELANRNQRILVDKEATEE